MKNATQLLFLMGLASTSLFAQEVSGYEKVAYFSPADIEVEDVNLSSKNAIAQLIINLVTSKVSFSSFPNQILSFIQLTNRGECIIILILF